MLSGRWTLRTGRGWPRSVREARPDAVINCIGVIKQRKDVVSQSALTIEINALLPHRLRDLCSELRARLIHFSTDCVFSGRTGHYRESDEPDALDLYGRSKLLGEVHEAPGVTIGRRSSVWSCPARRGLLSGFFRSAVRSAGSGGRSTRESQRRRWHVSSPAS
jgi:dTDP-4-dehydrorhamnose reductase